MNRGLYMGETDLLTFPTDAGVVIMDSSGQFVVPSPNFEVSIAAGGCGGSPSNGGPAGGYVYKRFTGALVGSVATVVIGAAGVGNGAANSPVATNGGLSLFTLEGFTSLSAGAGNVSANTGGTATGGDINIAGQVGSPPFLAAGTDTNGNIGGSGPLGFGGQRSGAVATGAGAGGSGGAVTGGVSVAGGNGTSGRAIIRWEKT